MPAIYIKAIVALFIISVVAGGYWYVTNLQKKLEFKIKENIVLSIGLEQEKAAHAFLVEEVARNNIALEKTNNKLQTIRKERDEAVKEVQDSRLSRLAKAKPGRLAIRAKRASIRLWRDFEGAFSPSTKPVLPSPAN